MSISTPDSSMSRRATSAMRTGSPMSRTSASPLAPTAPDGKEVTGESGGRNRPGVARRNLRLERGEDRTSATQNVAEPHAQAGRLGVLVEPRRQALGDPLRVAQN